MKHIKLVVVGDKSVGKDQFLACYCTGHSPDDNSPIIFDNSSINVMIDEENINLQLWNSSNEDMKNIRTLVYPQTDVFIVLFSLVNPTSLENAENMWIPEVKYHCPGTPYIIVGVQSSLRDNFHLHEAEYKSKGWSPVSYDQAEVIRQKTGAHAYVECDLSTQYHLKEAFEAASRYAIRYMDLKPIIEEVLLKYRKKQEKEAKKEKKKKKE